LVFIFKAWKRTFSKRFSCCKSKILKSFSSLQNEKTRVWSVFHIYKMKEHVFEAFLIFTKWKNTVLNSQFINVSVFHFVEMNKASKTVFFHFVEMQNRFENVFFFFIFVRMKFDSKTCLSFCRDEKRFKTCFPFFLNMKNASKTCFFIL